MNNIKLIPLEDRDREQFILDNQEAFNFGALEEFGRRDDHFEEDEQIISLETIENSIDNGEAYRIMLDGRISAGGRCQNNDLWRNRRRSDQRHGRIRHQSVCRCIRKR